PPKYLDCVLIAGSKTTTNVGSAGGLVSHEALRDCPVESFPYLSGSTSSLALPFPRAWHDHPAFKGSRLSKGAIGWRRQVRQGNEFAVAWDRVKSAGAPIGLGLLDPVLARGDKI